MTLVLAYLAVPALSFFSLGSGADASEIALFTVQNAAGDSAAVSTVDLTLRFELSKYGSLVSPDKTRDTLRRLRIRAGDHAPPALLRLLGEELGVDWLVTVTVHDTERRTVPQLTMSIRVYSGATGELIWMNFRGGSGLDRRKVLGLGVLDEMDSLIPFVIRDLLQELPAEIEPEGARNHGDSPPPLGRVAVVPFAGWTKRRPTLNAETVTEAVRSELFKSNIDLVSPNLVYEVLRQQQAGRWDGVAAGSRTALHAEAGADTILVGEVETYEVGGSEFEPKPKVVLAMRLLDARTGHILWTGDLDRNGWDGQSLLGLGRIYSRGALAERMMVTLTRRLQRDTTKILHD